jgi:hypothetical protein
MKRARARVAREITTTMRVAGEGEGKAGKTMAMATRVVGKHTAMLTKRAMAKKTREVGKEEGNGKGGKSNGDAKKAGNGKPQ